MHTSLILPAELMCPLLTQILRGTVLLDVDLTFTNFWMYFFLVFSS